MNNFMNKLFNGLKLNGMTKNKNQPKAIHKAAGILREMPENVLYGEDSGAVPPDEFKNQLDNDIK